LAISFFGSAVRNLREFNIDFPVRVAVFAAFISPFGDCWGWAQTEPPGVRARALGEAGDERFFYSFTFGEPEL